MALIINCSETENVLNHCGVSELIYQRCWNKNRQTVVVIVRDGSHIVLHDMRHFDCCYDLGIIECRKWHIWDFRNVHYISMDVSFLLFFLAQTIPCGLFRGGNGRKKTNDTLIEDSSPVENNARVWMCTVMAFLWLVEIIRARQRKHRVLFFSRFE